jgi:hypothetical protein
MHVTYNPATNRQTGEVADANGNIGSGNVWDIDNRLSVPSGLSAFWNTYYYDAGNKRTSTQSQNEFTFWFGNLKLATYRVTNDFYTQIFFTPKTTSVYFGGKLVSKGTYSAACTCADKIVLAPVGSERLGSIGKFYPYGQERPSATTNDTEKFTGYFRDQATGLDYADQRYHP